MKYTMYLLLVFFSLTSLPACSEGEAPDPDNIYNYHEVSDRLATSGQVFPAQLPKLQDESFGLIVNLAVADEERNGQESFHVTNAGMSYVQIPVIWEKPTQADLDLFFAVMDARGDRKTLVHCFANYRASAFTFLYRVLRQGVPEAEARKDLMAIWSEEAFDEYPQWRAFIDGNVAAARSD